MVRYICDTCKKVFIQKIDLDRHKNRKNKCIFIIKDVSKDEVINTSNPPLNTPIYTLNTPITPPTHSINNKDDINLYKCNNCYKKFTRIDNYKRHALYRCKFFDAPKEEQEIEDNNKIINLLLKQYYNYN